MIKDIKDNIDNKRIENKANDKNKNSKDKIDYEEKLKEVDELNNKVNELSNIINSFQDNMAISISKLLDEKLSGLKKQELVNARKSSSIADSGLLENIDENDVDMVFGNKSESDKVLVSEVKSVTTKQNKQQTINGKLTIRQKELPFFDKQSGTGSFLGGAIGSLFAGAGGFTLGMKMGSKFDSTNNESIKKNLIDTRRKFLEDYPVKNYDEFVQRVKVIDPYAKDEDLENIKKDRNIHYLNEFILDVYDNQKALQQYKMAKAINENNDYKYGIPYIEQDFNFYTLSNDLKNILKSRGISLEKFSELIEVNKNTMTNIVNNKNTSSENMFKISLVLQLPIEEIFKYELKLDKYIREFLEVKIKESYNKD